MVQYMLTTYDNPYNPFQDFTKWFLWDTEKGYNSCAYLARVVADSSSFDDKEENAAIEQAIDEIISADFMNVYCKLRFDGEKTDFVDVKKENIVNQVNQTA